MTEFAALCARERAPWAQLGTATADGHLLLADREGPNAVDIPLELVLGKPPRMTRRAEPMLAPRFGLELGGATVAEAVDRVLGLPTVADKSFLVTIGDRTVGGLVARDPMIGRFQVPVADCALTTAGFDTYQGEVMAIGERPPVALLDAAAASRLAIGEAITNLAAAPIGPLGRIKLSCNWMAAAGHPGEDAALYAAVRACSDAAVALGLAIPVGKDSMSMRTVWPAEEAGGAVGDVHVVVSPVTLVVTAFGPCNDVRRAVTPELRGGDRELLLVDLGGGQARLGASCLAQVFNQLGDTPPDLDDPKRLHHFYDAIQQLVVRATSSSAYHDRSDGGVVVTLLEMAFCSGLGLDLDLTTLARRSVPRAVHRRARCGDRGRDQRSRARHRGVVRRSARRSTPIGRATTSERIRITHGCAPRARRHARVAARSLVARHATRSRAAATIRSAPTKSTSIRLDGGSIGLAAHLTFDPTDDVAAPAIRRNPRPRVAILREQGVNGQIEMAAAFTRAGFDADRRPHDRPRRGPRRPARRARCRRVRRLLVRRRARCRPRLGLDVPLQRARTRRDPQRSSRAPTRSCSACATAAR